MRLILMVGLPRSGKTTTALELSKELSAPIVNPDAIRLAVHGKAFYPPAEPIVWGIAKTMVTALFQAGHDTVIVDACNNTTKRRAEWKTGAWDVEVWYVATNYHTCRARAEENGDQDLLPVIERMAVAHQPPMPEEGFTDITFA
jgi:predicted kinase